MIKRLSPLKRLPIRGLLRRIDRVTADLNVLLMVLAIGLATIDVTLLVTRTVIANLPSITHGG